MSRESAKILENRKINKAKNLFIHVLEYFVYCYNKMIDDKTQISEKNFKNETALAFENYLKWHFVSDYLRKNRENYKNKVISKYEYRCEPAELYKSDKIRENKIDIQVCNLDLKWKNIDKELIYFVFECKRLKNKGKNIEYITDIAKFVSREYEFRFPFNGLIGFVERSRIKISEIIEDIDFKLKNKQDISSQIINNRILNPYHSETCLISAHTHRTRNNTIEIYHLFFDYSKIIVN